MLKKYVKNGGISKGYLGSKNFDPTLIEPIKKKSVSTCIKDYYLDSAFAGQLSPKLKADDSVD